MEDRSNDILTVTWLFLALTWFTIILRVYVRGYLLSNTWGKDDWSMVATIVRLEHISKRASFAYHCSLCSQPISLVR